VNTLIVLFNLRSDADPVAYEKWAKSTDLPVVTSLSAVSSFDVYRSAGLFGSGSPAPYRYVEVIDITDVQQFGRDLDSATMKRVASEFQSFADNPVFMLTDKIS
jgi:REDY-like protein HapK